jgi:hypothetical protein
LDNIFEFEDHLAGEKWIEPTAANAMQIIGRRTESGVSNPECVIELCRFSILGAHMINDIVIFRVTQMDFVRGDADNWS